MELLDRVEHERARSHLSEARCAWGAYLVARLVHRWIELKDSENLEALRWLAESVHRQVDDLPQDRDDIGRLKEILRTLSGGQPSHVHWSLMAFSSFLQTKGRKAEALAILRLATRTYEDPVPAGAFVTIALQAAFLYLESAEWDQSYRVYAAAEQAARFLNDPPLALVAVLGQARALAGRGETSAARTVVKRILAVTHDAERKQLRSDTYALLSTLLPRLGQPLEGLEAAYQAARLERAPPGPRQRLFDLGTALADQNYYMPARLAFQLVADSDEWKKLRDQANLALMQLATAQGDRLAFERHRSALSDMGYWPAEAVVDYQFRLGLGLARFRQFTRARVVWSEALALPQEQELNRWCVRLEEKLAGPADIHVGAPRIKPSGQTPRIVTRITSWLRRMRRRCLS